MEQIYIEKKERDRKKKRNENLYILESGEKNEIAKSAHQVINK